MKNLLDEYLVQVLFFGTIILVVYIFRKQIFSSLTGAIVSDLTGKTVEQYQSDVGIVASAVTPTGIMELAQNIVASATKYISPEEQAAALARIKAEKGF